MLNILYWQDFEREISPFKSVLNRRAIGWRSTRIDRLTASPDWGIGESVAIAPGFHDRLLMVLLSYRLF
jgi:hypothetical protein